MYLFISKIQARRYVKYAYVNTYTPTIIYVAFTYYNKILEIKLIIKISINSNNTYFM